MPSTRQTLLCHYRYDPLDRLINQTQPDAPTHQRFYCKSRLVTEIQGAMQYSIFQRDDQLLAQQQYEGDVLDTTLLATDQQRSVLQTLKATNQRNAIAYSPYGYRPAENGLTSLLGFNGERPGAVTGHYLLGNGYRAFDTALMRFNSPDTLSPFGRGGLNAYGYCLGDPINKQDPSGHFPGLTGLRKGLKTLREKLRLPTKTTSNNTYSTLKNRNPEMLGGELESYEAVKNLDLNNSPISTITTADDLKQLQANQYHKFVLTQEGNLITGAPVKLMVGQNKVDTFYMSHGVLAFNPGEKPIISAGYLKTTTDLNITINNHSGHYKPPFKTLKPVRTLLESMGAQVTAIRAPGPKFKAG
jgi:RHS repeat-associated protein